MPPTRGLTLFVDADDTLWENNIYYEAVVADYLALAQRHGCPPERARARLIEVERERVGRFGYGISNFQASLELACRSIVEPAATVDTAIDCHVVRVAAPPGRHPPRRSRDHAPGPGRPPPGGAPDQGRRRRPDGQGRQIGSPAPPAPGGRRAREGRGVVSRRPAAARGRPGPDLDGRQQPEVGHPAGPGRGPGRGLRAPPGHLDPRTGGPAAGAHAPICRARSLPRPARLF